MKTERQQIIDILKANGIKARVVISKNCIYCKTEEDFAKACKLPELTNYGKAYGFDN